MDEYQMYKGNNSRAILAIVVKSKVELRTQPAVSNVNLTLISGCTKYQ